MVPSSKLFRSRWSALFWAGGILWFAYDVAGAAPHPAPANAIAAANASDGTDATGTAYNDADLAVLADAMGGGGGPPPKH